MTSLSPSSGMGSWGSGAIIATSIQQGFCWRRIGFGECLVTGWTNAVIPSAGKEAAAALTMTPGPLAPARKTLRIQTGPGSMGGGPPGRRPWHRPRRCLPLQLPRRAGGGGWEGEGGRGRGGGGSSGPPSVPRRTAAIKGWAQRPGQRSMWGGHPP